MQVARYPRLIYDDGIREREQRMREKDLLVIRLLQHASSEPCKPSFVFLNSLAAENEEHRKYKAGGRQHPPKQIVGR